VGDGGSNPPEGIAKSSQVFASVLKQQNNLIVLGKFLYQPWCTSLRYEFFHIQVCFSQI
jgi:hypothetical protein